MRDRDGCTALHPYNLQKENTTHLYKLQQCLTIHKFLYVSTKEGKKQRPKNKKKEDAKDTIKIQTKNLPN